MHDLWPIPMVCNDIPRDIPERDPPRTYVRTYVVRENRSLIQSLALMRSAISWKASLIPRPHQVSESLIVRLVVYKYLKTGVTGGMFSTHM